MPVSINVNGLSLVHKGSDGIAQATAPDVCLVPSSGGPVPVPFANVARSASLSDGTTSVTADGGQMIAVKGSQFSVSEGDEPGTAGGVASGTQLKEAKWLSFSPDVKIEGKNACRLTDKMTMNHGNTVCLGGEQQEEVSEEEVDCEETWAKFEEEAHEISDIEDPIERNQAISAAYAQVYQDNNDLRWSGAASFASKQVGCALTSARGRMNSPLGIVKNNATAMYEGLGEGNKAVFEEIYPVMKFYDEHGIEAVRRCRDSRDPPVPANLMRGLSQVGEGNLATGAELMLWHEQSVTLQTVVYDNPAFQQAIKLNQLGVKLWVGRLFGAEPIKANYSAECDAPYELVFDGSDFSNLEERWPFVRSVVEGFAEQDPTAIGEQLDLIIRRGSSLGGSGGGGGGGFGGGGGGAW